MGEPTTSYIHELLHKNRDLEKRLVAAEAAKDAAWCELEAVQAALKLAKQAEALLEVPLRKIEYLLRDYPGDKESRTWQEKARSHLAGAAPTAVSPDREPSWSWGWREGAVAAINNNEWLAHESLPRPENGASDAGGHYPGCYGSDCEATLCCGVPGRTTWSALVAATKRGRSPEPREPE
jgi:hypothetical protein